MEEWKQYKIRELTELMQTGPFGSQLHQSDYSATGTPLIMPQDIVDGKISTNKIAHVEMHHVERLTRHKMKKGEIIYPRRGELTKCALITEREEDWLCGSGCMKIHFDENKAVPQFMYYLFNTPTFYHSLNNATVGTTMPNLNPTNLGDISVFVPSLETQKRIASILSSLDSKIELNRRINDNLEQQAQALFKAWFVDFEPFKDGEFVDSELGSTPKELPIVYIGDIPHNIESGKRPKGGASLEGVPSIGAENIKGLGYYDYSKTKYIPEEYAQTIKKGKINGYELLIYKDGGKPGYFIPNFSIFGEGFPFSEMYINEHVFILNLMDAGYNAFAYFYMRTPYIMNQLNSIGGKAAIPGINTKDVECLPIFSKESSYVKRFGDIVLPIIKTILSNSLENAKLANLRDTLLPKLMSGELKINEAILSDSSTTCGRFEDGINKISH